jgi:hypothetical protein
MHRICQDNPQLLENAERTTFVKTFLASVLAVVSLASAQTVLPGLGANYSAYVNAYGQPTSAGDTLIDAQERVWKVNREGALSDVKMEVHAYFRGGKAVEERWLRLGKDVWTKDELWHVLDGKAKGFRMVRRSEGVPSPYQSLDNSNGLLYFVVPGGSFGAQLQRSARGPQIRVVGKDWAGILLSNGFGQTKKNRPVATLRKELPHWGGLKQSDMQSFMEKLGGRSGKNTSERTWLLPSNAGEITWKTVSSSLTVQARLKDAKAWKDWNDSKGNKEAVKADLFKRFGTLYYSVLPKLIGNLSWRVERIEGSVPSWSPNGAVRLLEAKGNIGEAWKLDLGPDGYILQVDWPVGVTP